MKTIFTTKRMFRAAHGDSPLLDRRGSSSMASQTGCMRVREKLLKHAGTMYLVEGQIVLDVTEKNSISDRNPLCVEGFTMFCRLCADCGIGKNILHTTFRNHLLRYNL